MSWLQLKRGSATAVASYTPKAGEPVLDTTNYRLVFGDGATLGGIPLKVTTGTSGDNIPLLSGANTWSGSQTFANSTTIFRNASGATGIEIGSVTSASNTFIDFHSSGTAADYDSRLVATGGSSTAGNGTLTLIAATFSVPGAVTFSGIFNVTGASAFKGIADGSSASAGYIGEYLSVTVSSYTMSTTATTYNVASLTLTPGEWDVTGSIELLSSAAVMTSVVSGLSLVSAVSEGFPYMVQLFGQSLPASTANRLAIPTRRVNVTSSTVIYLIASAAFSSGSVTAKGFIRANRVR